MGLGVFLPLVAEINLIILGVAVDGVVSGALGVVVLDPGVILMGLGVVPLPLVVDIMESFVADTFLSVFRLKYTNVQLRIHNTNKPVKTMIFSSFFTNN